MNKLFSKNFVGLQIAWPDNNEVEFLGHGSLSGASSYTAAKCDIEEQTLHYLYPVTTRREANTLFITYKSTPDAWRRYLGWEVIQGTLIVEFQSAESLEPRMVTWQPISNDKPEQLDRGTDWEYISENEVVHSVIVPRGKIAVSRYARPGQTELRNNLIAEYSGCQITSTTTLSVLEACHILPVKNGGLDVIGNALLLRRDLHSLFDLGLLSFHSVSSGWQVRVAPTVLDDHYQMLSENILTDSRFERHRPFLEAREKLTRQR